MSHKTILFNKWEISFDKLIKELVYGFISFAIAALFSLIPVWVPENYGWTIPLIDAFLHWIMMSLKKYIPEKGEKFKPIYQKIIDLIIKWMESLRNHRLSIP